jgi:hypothetical protein
VPFVFIGNVAEVGLKMYDTCTAARRGHSADVANKNLSAI